MSHDAVPNKPTHMRPPNTFSFCRSRPRFRWRSCRARDLRKATAVALSVMPQSLTSASSACSSRHCITTRMIALVAAYVSVQL